MLVKTGGVRIYAPGRGNFEAAKKESKVYFARWGKLKP